MPLPRSIARFNRRVTNPVLSKIASRLPGFAILHHIGRESGRSYRIPINAFRVDDGYILALTYGAKTDWVKNVLAAGACELETRGEQVRLTNPRIYTDRSNSWAPIVVRLILTAAHVTQHMRLSYKN